MQPNNRSSFIPKKSIKRVERVRSGKRIYILSYIAYGIFFATLLATAAVYFYAQFLEKELATKIEQLETQRVAFSQGNIEKVKEVERQLKMAEYLFDRHASPYAVLHEIERLAVEGIVFKSFGYKRIDDNDIELSITGGSKRFDCVAFQSGLLADSNVLKEADFTSVSKQGDGLGQAESQRNPSNQASTNEPDTDSQLPVSFTFNKLMSFDELQFDSSIFAATVISSGVPDTDVTSFTDDSGEDDLLGTGEIVSEEIES